MIDDENIKDVWAYHFPKYRESSHSKVALVGLIRLICECSTGCTEPETAAAAAHRFGIPVAEFEQFERER